MIIPTTFPTATLRALLDRLIPADEFPGALEAETEHYVTGQLAGDCRLEAPLLLRGLAQLDAEADARFPDSTFAALQAGEQDRLLREIESNSIRTSWPPEISATAFFARMVELAHEGYYADPANGGNRNAASWQMIGYDPRLPPQVKPPQS